MNGAPSEWVFEGRVTPRRSARDFGQACFLAEAVLGSWLESEGGLLGFRFSGFILLLLVSRSEVADWALGFFGGALGVEGDEAGEEFLFPGALEFCLGGLAGG